MDIRGLIIGAGRSSKSTLTAQLILVCTLYDYVDEGLKDLKEAALLLILKDWINTHVIYKDRTQMIEKLKTEYSPYIVSDDSLLLGDNRFAMDRAQAFLTQAMESYADSNAKTFMLCQRLSLLDPRFVDGSNFVVIVDLRGHGFLFIKEKNYPIVKNTYGFEIYKKHPKLLNETGLRSRPSYCDDLEFDDLEDNKFYQAWKDNKAINKKL